MDAIVYDKVGKEAEKVREVLYGIYPQETITDAAIASFDDGADGIPVKALTVGIEPVQDLHGYDHPWPSGGGKNLLNIELLIPNGTWNGDVYSAPNAGVQTMIRLFDTPTDVIVSSGARSGTATSARFQLYNENQESIDIVYISETKTISGVCFVRFAYGTDGTISITAPMIRLATETDATFAPYSNICPISGHTGAEINDTGINVWDEQWELGRFDTTTGANVSSTTQIRSKNFIPLKGGAEYYLKTPIAVWIIFFDKDKNPVSPPDYSWATINGKSIQIWNRVFQAPDSACYCRFYCLNDYGTTYNNDIGINYPETDTTYHPYTGDQISVTFPETIYGGEDEVISGNGTSTMAILDLGDLTWAYYDSSGHERFSSNAVSPTAKPAPGSTLANALCSSYKLATSNQVYSHSSDSIFCIDGDGKIQVYDSRFSDTTAFKTAVTGVKVVYELATPTTFTHDPQQISTLYGTNNIWSSTGDTEVTYRADLGKYIDSHITTAVANALNA